MEIQHRARFVVLGVVGTLLASSFAAWAISDNPPGKTVWLQGYDLNPHTGSFRNEGVVRLECIDDSLPIVLSVSEPGLHNAPGGLLWVAPGAGGSREFRGSLINEGEVRVGYGVLFTGAGSVVRNTATFTVGTSAAAWFLGPSQKLLQESGTLSVGGGLDVRDGEFHFVGGQLVGEPRLVRSRVVVSEAIEEPFSLLLAGEACRFEGAVLAGQTLRVAGTADQGPGRAHVVAKGPVAGRVVLTSVGAPATAVLEAGEGLTFGSGSVLAVEPGAGGVREIQGSVGLAGLLEVSAPLSFKASEPVANQGRVVVYAVGGLEAVGGYVQDAGSTELRGGRLASVRGIEVRSGSLSGAGLISGSVTNSAVVRAGDPSGPLRVAGDFHQSVAGRLVMSALRTPASREQAPLEVWGEVFLEGILKVTSPPGIAWEAGDRVALVTSDRLRGGLDQLELPPLPPGVHWEVEATAGAFHAVVAAGESEPRLSLVTAPGKPPRLRLSGALPLEVGVEVSTDLVTWTALPSRLEFSDDGVGVGGLPEFLSAESVFFRTVTRR